MVVVAAVCGGDELQHPVDDDGGQDRLGGLVVEQPVGSVEVPVELVQGLPDQHRTGQRQRTCGELLGDLGEPGELAGQRDPVPADPDLLPLHPRPGRRRVVEGVQLAGVHVRQALQADRAQPVQLPQQHRGLGEGLRPGQVGRGLRAARRRPAAASGPGRTAAAGRQLHCRHRRTAPRTCVRRLSQQAGGQASTCRSAPLSRGLMTPPELAAGRPQDGDHGVAVHALSVEPGHQLHDRRGGAAAGQPPVPALRPPARAAHRCCPRPLGTQARSQPRWRQRPRTGLTVRPLPQGASCQARRLQMSVVVPETLCTENTPLRSTV